MDQAGNLTLPGVLNDTTRINYYKSYLQELKKTINEGANVIGYFQWTFVDNFEWRLGYTSRFGIVYVDFDTLERYPKVQAASTEAQALSSNFQLFMLMFQLASCLLTLFSSIREPIRAFVGKSSVFVSLFRVPS